VDIKIKSNKKRGGNDGFSNVFRKEKSSQHISYRT